MYSGTESESEKPQVNLRAIYTETVIDHAQHHAIDEGNLECYYASSYHASVHDLIMNHPKAARKKKQENH
jgi:hypothetical protein